MLRAIHWLLLAMLAAVAPPAFAAPVQPPKCHLVSDYLVVTRDRNGETGEDIVVKAKPPTEGPCRYAVKAGDWEPKVDAAYFSVAGARFLALDVGTGPDRQLLVYDIAARRKVFGTPYDDARKVRTTTDGFVFWDVGAQPIKPATCPKDWRKDPDNVLASSAHVSREILFAFKDGKTRETGRATCMRTQGDM